MLQAGILENVLGLLRSSSPNAPSNLDVLVHKLSEMGMFVAPFVLDPQFLSWPVQRQRVWIFYIPRRLLRGMNDEAAWQLAVETVDLLMAQGQPVSLDSLLLAEDDAAVKQQREAYQRDAARLARALRYDVDWGRLHERYCKKHRIDWHGVGGAFDPGLVELFPALAVLTTREAELLKLKVGQLRTQAPGTCEVTQNVERSRHKVNGSGCITPTMKLILTRRVREALGIEAMRTQSLRYGKDHSKLRTMSSPLLRSLAGNALHAYCCAVTFMTSLAVLARGWPQSQGQAAGAAAAGEEPADSDLDELWGMS